MFIEAHCLFIDPKGPGVLIGGEDGIPITFYKKLAVPMSDWTVFHVTEDIFG